MITPRRFRAITPKMYQSRAYVKLKTDEQIEIDSIVFSVYQPKSKENNEPMTYEDGTPFKNVTIYIGFDEEYYTSIKNEIVEGQLSILTGFDIDTAEIGKQYDYNLKEKESVKVVEITKAGYSYPLIAFQQ